MIRILLCLLFVAMLASDSFCQRRFFGRIEGEPVSIVLTVDQLRRTPTWSTDEQNEPPLSVGKAIAAAKLAVSKEFPKLKDKQWTVSVVLTEEHSSINTDQHFTDSTGIEYYADDHELTIVSGKWVYRVRLTWQPVCRQWPHCSFCTKRTDCCADGRHSRSTKKISEPAEFRLATERYKCPNKAMVAKCSIKRSDLR